MLMRDAHGSFQFDIEPFTMDIHMEASEVPKQIKISPGETVDSLCKAEAKFLEPGVSLLLCDEQAPLGRNVKLQAAPLSGQFRLLCKKKRQSKEVEKGVIQLNFAVLQDHQVQMIGGHFLAGTFIFEALNALSLPRTHYFLHDAQGERVGVDSRAWHSMILTSTDTIRADGVYQVNTPVGGLSDLCLDLIASAIIKGIWLKSD